MCGHDRLAEVDEGKSIRCQLTSTLTCGENEYTTSAFTVEDRSNTDLSDVPDETAVA